MEVNEDTLKQLVKDFDKSKNIALQEATSGNNEAHTAVENTFMPITLSSSATVARIISSYLDMFSVLLENKKFLADHEQYIFKKIELYEALMMRMIEEEEVYKDKIVRLLEQNNRSKNDN
ncbi:hypothetical protein JCM9140_4870 [Halalkalibacter wakoensis JCM 9140]|uniref:Uncharacterized protein n=1 Tax=Halalkalibacter wakoensis JCM 9140 TaxID=1236970 RepID=W4QAA4_9BACI|nr:hypothetical protein [Halalkalibacter wakoensis]GAE28618.1 hypothetical protein JCM9140_4870 [Halalkalibacter wakoensis JCM 9140]